MSDTSNTLFQWSVPPVTSQPRVGRTYIGYLGWKGNCKVKMLLYEGIKYFFFYFFRNFIYPGLDTI